MLYTEYNQPSLSHTIHMYATLHLHHPHAPLACYFTVHHAKITADVRFFLAPLTQMTWQCNDMEKNISPGSVDCRWTGSFHANAALVEQLREMARHRSDQWFALLCTCQLILSRPAHLCCNVFNLFMHYITADPKLWPLVLSGYWDGDRFLQRRRGV